MSYIALILLSLLPKIVIAEEPLQQLVCEDETLFLSCPRGYAINILTALYGKKDPRYCSQPEKKNINCAAGNALNIMKFKCNRKQNCRVEASDNVFGDPCYGIKKYLEVTYDCVNVEILSSLACENDKVKINCPDGYSLWIVNALYGRTNPVTCFKENKSVLTNHCEASTAMNVLESRCDNLKECTVDASNGVFGDPCPYTYKYLEVDYQCLPQKPLQRLVDEDDTLFLSCPRGYAIDILTALYGKKDRGYCSQPINCAAGNALNIMKFKCNGRQNCRVQASNNVFQDPCFGIRKYLEVLYDCVKVEILSAVACEDDKLEINCADGYNVWIVNAMYGRKNPSTCFKENKTVLTNHCEAATAMHVLESRCDNLKECSVDASNGVFGDPCPGTYKYLEVDYLCLSGAAV